MNIQFDQSTDERINDKKFSNGQPKKKKNLILKYRKYPQATKCPSPSFIGLIGNLFPFFFICLSVT